MQDDDVTIPLPYWYGRPDTRSEISALVVSLAESNAPRLVRVFYDTLLLDIDAASFLDHEIVETRLVGSLEKWLRDVFQNNDDAETATAYQRKIGEVHARIKVPLHIVMKAAALLKAELSIIFLKEIEARETLAEALIFLNARMDWSLGIMSEAYMLGSVRRAQADEAFRLFAVGQDVSIEKEAQHAALMDWLQSILFPLFDDGPQTEMMPLGKSPFGIWFRHHADLVFQNSPGLEAIRDNLHEIDDEILPRIKKAKQSDSGDLRVQLGKLRALVDETKHIIASMFQSVAGIESGRDPLTRTLNRRFLPTIMSREIAISLRTKAPFSILMLDIDHFKTINDQWGHSAGDNALRQVVEVILNAIRFNDFIFRYGGEEFLIVLVETTAGEALQNAERLREKLASHQLVISDGQTINITASIGVAEYDGHPDYVQLIDAADQALYSAKRSGRNRTVIAGKKAA
ncbi:GGDEF domain-containing protein [Pseudochelatococcus contaminans]|uniref:Diguanylate cyclase DosC n=1 Tax=Pseudochelatococcus contaminans TaxID=1538103 RepID=A0A7W6EHF7_9HYPH|nr:GGDEF domain-containing protein [Pseudochelatococcus contaminans]MBB3810063.1 diguanylate cyclase [Pseudochelatococcus contaminans]